MCEKPEELSRLEMEEMDEWRALEAFLTATARSRDFVVDTSEAQK